jgi:hypothetical protein
MARSPEPDDAAQKDEHRHDHEGFAHAARGISDDADDERREHIAKEVDDQDVEGKGTGTQRRRDHIGQCCVAWTCVEEQAEACQEHEDPGSGEGHVDDAQAGRKGQHHRPAGDKEVRAPEPRRELVGQITTQKCGSQTGEHQNGAEDDVDAGQTARIAILMDVGGHPESHTADGKSHQRHGQSIEHKRAVLEKAAVLCHARLLASQALLRWDPWVFHQKT